MEYAETFFRAINTLITIQQPQAQCFTNWRLINARKTKMRMSPLDGSPFAVAFLVAAFRLRQQC